MLKTSVSQKGEEDYVSSHPSIVMAPLVDVGYIHSILTIYQYSRFGAIS